MSEIQSVVSQPTLPRLPSVGTLFRESFAAYQRIFPTVAALFLPVAALSIATPFFSGAVGIMFSLAIIGGILRFIVNVALLYVVSRGADAGASLKLALKNILAYLWLGLLTSVVAVGGFFLLIVPGIMFIVSFSPSTFVLVSEGRRGMAALVRSREYVHGYWWAVLGRMLLILLILGALFAFLGIASVFAFFTGVIPADEASQAVMGAVLSELALFFLLPFTFAYAYRIYEHLRAARPELAAIEPSPKRGFLIACGIIGIVAPLIIGMVILVGILSGVWFSVTGTGTYNVNISPPA